MRQDLLRRLTVLASQQQPDVLRLRYFLEPHLAPKPVDPELLAMVEALEPHVPVDDLERAVYWLQTFRPDLHQSPDCAGMLLIEARWHRDRDLHSEDYAWRHLGDRAAVEAQIARLGIVQ
jgi:hypothetical protein